MDKELNELRSQYKKDIPTSFTDQDKHRVYEKINGKRHSGHLIPKTLTAVFCAVLIFAGAVMVHDQTEQTDIASSSDPALAKTEADKYSIYLRNPDQNYVTFDPQSVEIGDTFGKIEVTSVDRYNDDAIVRFHTDLQLTGKLYSNSGEVILFKPEVESKLALPFADDDIGKKIQIFFDDREEIRKVFGIDHSSVMTIQDATINVDQVKYLYKPEHTVIHLSVKGTDTAEPGVDFTAKTYETSIKLSDKLLSVYENYAKALDDKLLVGLEPIDVFKLYAFSIHNGHNEVQYALYMKGEKYGTPDKETFLSSSKIADEEVYERNADEFYEPLKKIDTLTEVYKSNTEAEVWFNVNPGSEAAVRLIKDTDLGVWKVDWTW